MSRVKPFIESVTLYVIVSSTDSEPSIPITMRAVKSSTMASPPASAVCAISSIINASSAAASLFIFNNQPPF